jgi:imidazolonepropionase-like amidohydrolase
MKKRAFPSGRTLGLLPFLALLAPLAAQEDPLSPPANGPRKLDTSWHRLVGATVHVDPERTIENGSVVMKDGAITWVGPTPQSDDAWRRVSADGAREWNCEGLHVYAGLIDAHVGVDVADDGVNLPGEHWNPKVTPQRSALDGEGLDKKTREALRELGFAAAAISPKSGVFRGSSALVSLADLLVTSDSLALRPALHDHQHPVLIVITLC